MGCADVDAGFSPDPHRFDGDSTTLIGTSSEPLRAIIVAWALGGRHEVWDVPSKMLEEKGHG